VYLEDGGTSTKPCENIVDRAYQIRKTYCAPCHAPPAGMGGFNYVLDDQQLATSTSASYMDSSGHFLRMVVPGDPEGSWVYHRIESGAMPPSLPPPAMSPPRPTISDISVLYFWILTCLGPREGP
jgi:hypothetical protein